MTLIYFYTQVDCLNSLACSQYDDIDDEIDIDSFELNIYILLLILKPEVETKDKGLHHENADVHCIHR